MELEAKHISYFCASCSVDTVSEALSQVESVVELFLRESFPFLIRLLLLLIVRSLLELLGVLDLFPDNIGKVEEDTDDVEENAEGPEASRHQLHPGLVKRTQKLDFSENEQVVEDPVDQETQSTEHVDQKFVERLFLVQDHLQFVVFYN